MNRLTSSDVLGILVVVFILCGPLALIGQAASCDVVRKPEAPAEVHGGPARTYELTEDGRLVLIEDGEERTLCPAAVPAEMAAACGPIPLDSVGPGYVDSIENITAPDAGVYVRSPYGQTAIDIVCDQAVYWHGASPVPLTGDSSKTVNAQLREVYLRSQVNAVCDVHALVQNKPLE